MLVDTPTSTEAATSPQDGRDRATGTFLACLNHEVRTPLSGIIGMVDLLLETRLDEEQREYAHTARLCAENLFELLNATLVYSALEAGQFALETNEFSVREMLESAVTPHRARAAAKGLAVAVTLDSKLPETLIGDAPRMKELLGHLVANAVKFTPAGSVEVRAAVDAMDRLVLAVRDTGVGIPAEQLGLIFESFQQGESGLRRTYPGLGLGLAVARKLASLMGGRIGVESVAGSGSTFTVEIPVRRPPARINEWDSDASREASSGVWILAVDDNPIGLTVLRHMLAPRNYHVECVASGQAALRAAGERRFHLVLMDLQMPEMDGLTAAAELRKLPGYDSVPILALTANYSDDVREQCRAHGMQAFLSKPVEAGELHAVLSKYLRPKT